MDRQTKLFCWLVSPITANLQREKIKSISQWLQHNQISAESITRVTQRAHIVSISMFNKNVDAFPDFPNNLSQTFTNNVIIPFIKHQNLPINQFPAYVKQINVDFSKLQQKNPLINFLSIDNQQILEILSGKFAHLRLENEVITDFYKTFQEILDDSSLLLKLLAKYNFLLDGMIYLFYNELEKQEVRFSSSSLPSHISTVFWRAISFRNLLFTPTASAAMTTKKRPHPQEKTLPKEHKEEILDTTKDEYIGKYKILKVIGSGGMGTVLLAIGPETQKTVAIKKITDPDGVTSQDLLRFAEEARVASELDHKNLVKVYEVGTENDIPFIVMEYIEGTTLSQMILKERISLRRSIEIVRGIAEGLSYAHTKGIIHRDIKPSNIVIAHGVPKLMDFGVAKDVFAGRNITKTGEMVGTPKYMSPEQAQGHNIDARADIYSLGGVFYELVTGTCPVKGRNAVDIIYNVVHVDPVSPRKIRPHLPAQIEAICLKAMDKDRSQRYENAQDMILDMNRFSQGSLTVAIRRMTPWARFKRWTNRKKKVLIPSLLAITSIVCCLITIVLVTKREEYSKEILELKEKTVSLVKAGKIDSAMAAMEKINFDISDSEIYSTWKKVCFSFRNKETTLIAKWTSTWQKYPEFEHMRMLYWAKKNNDLLCYCAHLLSLGQPLMAKKQILALKSQFPQVELYLLAYCSLLLGDFEDSQKKMEELNNKYMSVAKIKDPVFLYHQQNYPLCYEIINNRENNYIVLTIKALIHLKFNQISKAKVNFQQVLEQLPDLKLAQFGLALCHILSGKYKEAKKCIDDLIAKKPDYALFCRANYRLILHATEESWLNGYLKKQFKILGPILSESTLNPKVLSECYLLKGLCYSKLEEWQFAISALEQAQSLGNQSKKSYCLLAHALYKVQKYKNALHVITKGMKIYESSVRLTYTRGLTLYQLDKYGTAYTCFIRVENSTEKYYPKPLALTTIYKNTSEMIDELLNKYPTNFQPIRLSDKQLIKELGENVKGDWQTAIEKIYKAVVKRPPFKYRADFFTIVTKLARKLRAAQQHQQAIDLIEKMLQISQCKNSFAYRDMLVQLTQLHIDLKNQQQALATLQKLVQAFPTFVNTYKIRGKSLWKMKNKEHLEQIRADFNFAIMLCKSDPQQKNIQKEIEKELEKLNR